MVPHRFGMIDFQSSTALLAAADTYPLFSLLAIMFAAVVLVSLLLIRVRQSLLIGYFCCGIVIANTGIIEQLGGGDTQAAVQQMAEFGVMLLMFVLGMEFSISELRFLRRFALVGGVLQMGLCLLVVTVVAKLTGLSWTGAFVVGVALAMSSTAVSLKTFQDMELSGSPGARLALGIAIFQDIFIIVFLVFLPLLLNTDAKDEGVMASLGMVLLRGSAFIVLAGVSAKWVIPTVLHAVARTRSRELFSLTVVGCCICLAYIGSLLQLGLALGAFVAGLAVSESEVGS